MLQHSSKDRRGFTAKVGDFGLARVCLGQDLIPDCFGTISHMPPESLLHGRILPEGGEWNIRFGRVIGVSGRQLLDCLTDQLLEGLCG